MATRLEQEEQVRLCMEQHLEPDERFATGFLGQIGSTSVGRQVATAAAVAVVTAGMFSAWSTPRSLWVAVTDRRMVFLDPHAMSGKPSTTIVSQLPLAALSVVKAGPSRTMFMPVFKVVLAVAGQTKGLSVTLPMPWRTWGPRLLEALGAGSIIPA